MKIVGNILVMLAVGIVIVGGLAFFLKQGTVAGTEKDVTVTIAAGNDMVLREVIDARREDVEGTDGCDVKILYPQIEESSAISSDIRTAMNLEIEKIVKEFLTANESGVDEAMTDFLASCKENIAEGAWTSEIGYDVKQNKNDILSIGISNALNQGGAHPNITQLFITFNVQTGKQLTLRDVVDPEKITAFEIKEKQWLVDNTAEQLFEESLIEFRAYVAAPTDDATNRYIDDLLFYLTPDAVGIYYNPYLIAPYVAGPIAVEIPRVEIGM